LARFATVFRRALLAAHRRSIVVQMVAFSEPKWQLRRTSALWKKLA
jgi:hypothetical protein